MKSIREDMGPIARFFSYGAVKQKRVYDERFWQYFWKEKFRLVHPFTWALLTIVFILYIIDGGIKNFISDAKENICIM